ncbi:MAG: helix-turn-helix transcriptional regulator [Flavobacteriales bacterium]|jgi:DNA-binding NarL/FixJ family response regulator|nr:helix-turn-helix transcriptional regulator [Flavobacteriales bacterium]
MATIKLTKREHEIYKLILMGKSNQKIADELFISINTVKTHVAKILAKKSASNRIQLITNQNK